MQDYKHPNKPMSAEAKLQFKPNIETRQQVRWSLTAIIFGELWEKFKIPRRIMRKMSRDMMHKRYKEMKADAHRVQ